MRRRFARRRALITGGLGFIGSNLARRLVELGCRVTLVDSLHPDLGGNRANVDAIADQVEIVIRDVRDVDGLQPLVAGQDFLFNLAGQSSHLASMQDPFTDLEHNCRTALAVLEACRRYNPEVRIVYASTRQIYGRPERLPVDERHPLHPADINGVHKLAAERYHFLYRQVHGLKVCALRLTNTIGPAMRVKDGRQTFLGVWVRRLLEGEPFEVWGGWQMRDFTYVDDAVEAFLLAATSARADGQVFNLGGERAISLGDAARLLVEVNSGGEYVERPFPPERKAIEIGDYYAAGTKIRKLLGWQPSTPLREALRRTLDYYRRRLALYL
jgi:UDP-glucose 4-epimerase